MKGRDAVHALFLVLNETEYLDDILTAFVDIGVKGATILDSQGMGRALLDNENKQIPLFGSIKSFLNNSHPYNKTIFTILEDDALVDKVVQTVKSILGDMSKPGVGLMFTVPIGKVYGMRDD